MTQLADFHMKHRGDTCLIVGVGPNLELTPPEWFDWPSFGVNTIYKRAGEWKPTYFVGVDERLKLEDGAAIVEKYPDVPKFFPAPDWDDLKGENIYRFAHRPGDLGIGGYPPTRLEAITKNGIAYYRVMDAVFQIAMWMGFKTMLMIGIQHDPDNSRAHFWGEDEKAIPNQPFDWWFTGYKHFASMPGIRVLNISVDTHVPGDVLPRGNWWEWSNYKTVSASKEFWGQAYQ